MKLNPKIYKNLNQEPFLEQEIEGVKVAFYDMNETQYLTQYAGRGKFALWTSNGGDDYKVLIEKSYYEALQPFYDYDVNKIWIDFLSNAGNITKKMSRLFLIPSLIFYVLISTLALLFLEDQIVPIFLGVIVVIFGINIFQTRVTSNKVREANIQAQDQIRETLGATTFDQLVVAQEEHYKNYFKFDEEEKVESQDENTNKEDE